MLHIILLILKIIGIVIGVILGILILCTVILITAPLAYRLDASCRERPEDLQGCIVFRWFGKLIAGEIRYDGGNTEWMLRAGWKRFGSEMKPQEKQKADEESIPADLQTETTDTDSGKRSENSHAAAAMTEKSDDTERVQSKSDFFKKSNKEKRIHCKFLLKEKIEYTFQTICDKIKSLVKTKDRLKIFLTSEIHRSAWNRIIRELCRFFRFLRPRSTEAEVEFGFSDPAHTGYMLAFLSMICPEICAWAHITPDFEHRMLRGRVMIQGKIRALHVLIPAWNIFWDRNVRITYRHIKKLKQNKH